MDGFALHRGDKHSARCSLGIYLDTAACENGTHTRLTETKRLSVLLGTLKWLARLVAHGKRNKNKVAGKVIVC